MKGIVSKSITLFHLLRERRYYAALESLLSLLKMVGIYIHITELFSCDSDQHTKLVCPTGLVIRTVDSSEISLITSIENKAEEKLKERMLEWRDECRGIFLRGELAGYAWIAREKIRIPEVAFEKNLRGDEIYLYDVFIREEFRNQGLWVYFLRELIREVVLHGGRLISAADLTNQTAREIKLKNGLSKIERVTLIQIGKIWEYQSVRLFHNPQ